VDKGGSVKSLIAVLLLVIMGTPGIAPASKADQKWVALEVVTSYVSGTSPTLILGLDNNLEICLALREPRKISELRSDGVAVTDSQLALLQLWRLVERLDDGRMKCTVPVIESPVTTELEALAQTVTEELLSALGSDVDRYVGMVREAGWPGSSYALLGSFVLDDLAWKALERLGAIEHADASAMDTGSPHWSGVTWITLPPQTHKLGTNSYPTPDGVLCMTWTPSSLPEQEVLGKPGLREELTALASGRLAGPSADQAQVLERLGLVHDGGLKLPVIRADTPMCVESGRLAMQAARALVVSEPFREMKRLTGAQDPSVAVIMAYHWVYPRLMSQLELQGLTRPLALDGESGAPLGPTTYIVENETAGAGASE